MGSNSSSTAHPGNPVLYTFGSIIVQPYWLIITQLIVIQILQRLYSRFACWIPEEKRTWFIALEIAVLKERAVPTNSVADYREDVEERLRKLRPKYSVLDFILSLISIGHFIYACYRQKACSSDVNYSSWQCYNAFGYRLYNYVLPSVISVLVQSIIQAVNTHIASNSASSGDTDTRKRKKAQNYCKMFLLVGTIASNSLICLVFVPYFITNALPMYVGFCWLLVPVMLILTLAYALFVTTIVSTISKCGMCSDGYCLRFFGTHCAVGLQVFGCLTLSMAYNYSQYCYFGGGYIAVLGYEFQSRDTVTWGQSLVNSSDLQIHNTLAFF